MHSVIGRPSKDVFLQFGEMTATNVADVFFVLATNIGITLADFVGQHRIGQTMSLTFVVDTKMSAKFSATYVADKNFRRRYLSPTIS